MSSLRSTAASVSVGLARSAGIEKTFGFWADVVAEIGSFRLSARRPLGERRRFKSLFDQTVRSNYLHAGDFLALLFGSLGRAEPAQDIDLLVIVPDSHQWFRYDRLTVNGIKVDLNVASLPWLDEAWADLEWGYCLSEAYLLHTTLPHFEESFRRAVRRYWSSQNRHRRRSQHLKGFFELAQASDDAMLVGLDVVGRILGHEAIRSAAISVIDQFGNRVYSHRSFVSELRHAGRRAGLPSKTIEMLISGLCNSLGHAATPDYVVVRQNVSEIFRALAHSCGLQYEPGATRIQRIKTLCQLAKSPAGGRLEQRLEGSFVNSWLPEREQLRRARRAAQDIFKANSTNQIAVRIQGGPPESIHRGVKRCDVPEAPVPQMNPMPGARWVDLANGRLKLILSTGGCKTPSCVFCSLPAYGSRLAPRSPAETVGQVLRQHRPKELVLYNDGSLLNPAEVSSEELTRIFDKIRSAKLDRLWLESIPRFVTDRLILELLDRTRVQNIVLAMGFQCVGNWAAVNRLGRPDADSVFDQAIELLHRLGVQVRLYLLWGHPAFPLLEWRNLLHASIRWARTRNVKMITICPFVLAHQRLLERKFDQSSLCELRSALSGVRLDESIAIQISLPAIPSCGVQLPEGCAVCVQSLRNGNWASDQPCDRKWIHQAYVKTDVQKNSRIASDHSRE